MTEQNAATPAPQEVAYNTTQDAAEALLARWNTKSEQPATGDDSESEVPEQEEREQPDDEQPDEGTAEASSEQEAQVEDIELDVAGEKFKLPKALQEQAERIQRKVKDLEAGTRRKFDEAAEVRKSLESEREVVQNLRRFAEQQTDLLADMRATTREIESLNRLDWNSLSDSDPVTAQKHMARLMQLQHMQQQIGGQLQQAAQQMNAQQQQLRAERAARGQERLTKLIPNLSDSVKQDLAQYIAQRDLTPEGKEALWDPEVVAAFHDAKKYRELMSAKPADKRAVQAQKTLRPGTAAAPSTSAKAEYEKAKKDAFKTGSTESIAAAILARARYKR